MRSTLASRRLRRILAAYTVNRLGTWIGLVALLVATFDHTHSSLAVAALLLAGQAFPAFVVPALVARVETSVRGRELSALYGFEALMTAGLAGVLLWRYSLPLVLVLAALDGTAALAASALLRTAVARAGREQALAGRIQDAVAERAGETRADSDLDELGHEGERSANAALNVCFSATFVAGPVIGGALTAGAGAPAALLVDVASFLACGALLLNERSHVSDAAGDSATERLRSAWRQIRRTPLLPALLLIEAIAWIFFESGGPIEVAYAKATLAAGDSGFGLLLSIWGAGAVVGSLAFARSRRPLGILLCSGMLGIGLGYVGFALAPALPLACVAAFVGGLGNGLQWASLFTAVQRLTPQEFHGRLMGAVESLSALCLAAGLALGGALVAVSSPRTAFLVVGVGAVSTTIALTRLPLKMLAPGHESPKHREDHSRAPSRGERSVHETSH